ncbi:MAG: hypothetical protein IJT18_03465 [Oscillospiraceae bacterium]|nr:hypothetical protein [Oscillospiraceae bacterium]
MKKIIAIALAVVLALALAACGEVVDGPGMVNPWTDVKTAQDAADGAGVGYFKLPAENTETPIGPVNWTAFRCMKGIAEADGFVGVPELTIRKGLKQDTKDVSGDYNEYKFTWTEDVGDWQVTCSGNTEGRAAKAIWLSDNFSYSIMVRGQGSEAETFGLDRDTLTILVLGTE